MSSRPYSFGVPVYPDLYPGSSLGGLHAALTHARCDWVGVAACDMPSLTADYWRKLLEYVGGAQAVVVAGPSGRLEPLAALYHKSLLGRAERQLGAGNLEVQAFLGSSATCIVPWEQLGVDARTFTNANRPTDLP